MNGVYSSRVLLQNPDIAQQKDIHFYLDGPVKPPKKLGLDHKSIDVQTARHNLNVNTNDGMEVKSPKKTFQQTVSMLK